MPAEPPPDECAQCGAAIPRTARACPECGADERTGWREMSVYDGLELPDEGGSGETDSHPGTQVRRINGVAWYWWCVAIAVVLLFALGVLALR
jgi:hypothetical protein